jgi:HK97 family phage major capsid protein
MGAGVAELTSQLAAVNQKLAEQDDHIRALRARRVTGAVQLPPGGWVPGHPPGVRKGANLMGCKGFSFAKLIGAMGTNANLRQEDAAFEIEFCQRLYKACPGFSGSRPSAQLAPLWADGFGAETVDAAMRHEMKSMLEAGTEGYDPDEAEALWRKHFAGQTKATVSSPVTPSMSWVDQTAGGTFVPPATFGQPIDLIRANEALLQAGATVTPLGPSGKLTMPSLTGATQGGWAGENQQQVPVNPKTGNLTLSAKKVIATVVFPGELLRFGTPTTEGMVRNDLFKTVSLLADKGFLDGPGSDQVPLGLATMGAATGNPYGLAIVTPSAVGVLAPQDCYAFLSGVEEHAFSNISGGAWIMRPKMWYAFCQARWTPFSGGGQQGGFTFDMTRSLADMQQKTLAGCKVVTSTQVSLTRGSGTQTYVLFLGDPSDVYVGMFGAIELTQTDQGFTLLTSDQVAVRALLHCDAGPRHPGILAFADALTPVVQN